MNNADKDIEARSILLRQRDSDRARKKLAAEIAIALLAKNGVGCTQDTMWDIKRDAYATADIMLEDE